MSTSTNENNREISEKEKCELVSESLIPSDLPFNDEKALAARIHATVVGQDLTAMVQEWVNSDVNVCASMQTLDILSTKYGTMEDIGEANVVAFLRSHSSARIARDGLKNYSELLDILVLQIASCENPGLKVDLTPDITSLLEWIRFEPEDAGLRLRTLCSLVSLEAAMTTLDVVWPKVKSIDAREYLKNIVTTVNRWDKIAVRRHALSATLLEGVRRATHSLKATPFMKRKVDAQIRARFIRWQAVQTLANRGVLVPIDAPALVLLRIIDNGDPENADVHTAPCGCSACVRYPVWDRIRSLWMGPRGPEGSRTHALPSAIMGAGSWSLVGLMGLFAGAVWGIPWLIGCWFIQLGFFGYYYRWDKKIFDHGSYYLRGRYTAWLSLFSFITGVAVYWLFSRYTSDKKEKQRVKELTSPAAYQAYKMHAKKNKEKEGGAEEGMLRAMAEMASPVFEAMGYAKQQADAINKLVDCTGRMKKIFTFFRGVYIGYVNPNAAIDDDMGALFICSERQMGVLYYDQCLSKLKAEGFVLCMAKVEERPAGPKTKFHKVREGDVIGKASFDYALFSPSYWMSHKKQVPATLFDAITRFDQTGDVGVHYDTYVVTQRGEVKLMSTVGADSVEKIDRVVRQQVDKALTQHKGMDFVKGETQLPTAIGPSRKKLRAKKKERVLVSTKKVTPVVSEESESEEEDKGKQRDVSHLTDDGLSLISQSTGGLAPGEFRKDMKPRKHRHWHPMNCQCDVCRVRRAESAGTLRWRGRTDDVNREVRLRNQRAVQEAANREFQRRLVEKEKMLKAAEEFRQDMMESTMIAPTGDNRPSTLPKNLWHPCMNNAWRRKRTTQNMFLTYPIFISEWSQTDYTKCKGGLAGALQGLFGPLATPIYKTMPIKSGSGDIFIQVELPLCPLPRVYGFGRAKTRVVAESMAAADLLMSLVEGQLLNTTSAPGTNEDTIWLNEYISKTTGESPQWMLRKTLNGGYEAKLVFDFGTFRAEAAGQKGARAAVAKQVRDHLERVTQEKPDDRGEEPGALEENFTLLEISPKGDVKTQSQLMMAGYKDPELRLKHWYPEDVWADIDWMNDLQEWQRCAVLAFMFECPRNEKGKAFIKKTLDSLKLRTACKFTAKRLQRSAVQAYEEHGKSDEEEELSPTDGTETTDEEEVRAQKKAEKHKLLVLGQDFGRRTFEIIKNRGNAFALKAWANKWYVLLTLIGLAGIFLIASYYLRCKRYKQHMKQGKVVRASANSVAAMLATAKPAPKEAYPQKGYREDNWHELMYAGLEEHVPFDPKKMQIVKYQLPDESWTVWRGKAPAARQIGRVVGDAPFRMRYVDRQGKHHVVSVRASNKTQYPETRYEKQAKGVGVKMPEEVVYEVRKLVRKRQQLSDKLKSLKDALPAGVYENIALDTSQQFASHADLVTAIADSVALVEDPLAPSVTAEEPDEFEVDTDGLKITPRLNAATVLYAPPATPFEEHVLMSTHVGKKILQIRTLDKIGKEGCNLQSALIQGVWVLPGHGSKLDDIMIMNDKMRMCHLNLHEYLKTAPHEFVVNQSDTDAKGSQLDLLLVKPPQGIMGCEMFRVIGDDKPYSEMFRATLIGKHPSQPGETIQNVEAAKHVDDGQYWYAAESEPGLCGALLFDSQTQQIVGMHVGTYPSGRLCNAVPLTGYVADRIKQLSLEWQRIPQLGEPGVLKKAKGFPNSSPTESQ